MIRTRLAAVIGMLVGLCLLMLAFTLWSTQLAQTHMQKSTLARTLLQHYLELGANKQRLKVWFAQATLASDNAYEVRDALSTKMSASLFGLQQALADPKSMTQDAIAVEMETVQRLTRNFDNMRLSLVEPPALAADAQRAQAWASMIKAFDEADGTDMRVVLASAVERQRAAVELATTEHTEAMQLLSMWATVLIAGVLALGFSTLLYVDRRMHKPFQALLLGIDRLGRGELQIWTRSHKADEFSLIGESLQKLAERLHVAHEKTAQLQAQSELVRQGLDRAVAQRTQELSESHAALVQIDSRRKQFIAEISHELRTPVTVIRGETELALRNKNADAQLLRDAMLRVQGATQDLLGRVADLVHAARDNGSAYALAFAPVRMSTLVSKALAQTKAIAAHRHIEVVDLACDKLTQTVVSADKERLHQALMVVLDNAVRYSRNGGEVTASAVTQGAWLHLYIDDSGIGMSDTEREQAFERNFRGERARALQPEGVGLGLTIAQMIVHAHGGHIELLAAHASTKSTEVAGTRAVVSLPLHPSQIRRPPSPVLPEVPTPVSSQPDSVPPRIRGLPELEHLT